MAIRLRVFIISAVIAQLGVGYKQSQPDLVGTWFNSQPALMPNQMPSIISDTPAGRGDMIRRMKAGIHAVTVTTTFKRRKDMHL